MRSPGRKSRPFPRSARTSWSTTACGARSIRPLGVFKLVSPERGTRLKAVDALEDGADPSSLPLIRKAFRARDRSGDQARLELIAASIELASGDRATRLAAVRNARGRSGNPNTKTLLLSLAKKDGGGEADPEIRAAAEASLRAVEGRLLWGERLGLAFAGISLGSILLLAALGLAITYG